MHDTICDSDPRNEPKEDEAEETPTHRVHLRDRCAASNEELCVHSTSMVDLHLLHFEGIQLFLDSLR